MDVPRPARGPWWATAPSIDTGGGPITCTVCGAPLGDDADDMPDLPDGPMCGACARARAFDQTLWELDLEEPGSGLW